MPRATKNTEPAQPAKEKSPAVVQPRRGDASDEWGGFVQANLSPMDKALFDQWHAEHLEHIQAYLDEHVGGGLKLSLVFDGEHNSYIASYTGRPNARPELPFRCTLSARAGQFLEALALLVYKHEVICGKDWTDFLVNGSRTQNWG